MPDWQAIFGDAPAWQVIAWIAAVSLALTLLVKLWPFVRHSVKIVDSIITLPEMSKQVNQLAKQIDEIHHETHRNDGTSLKDAVDRVEVSVLETAQSVEGLHGRLDVVESDTGALRARADAAEREDEALWAEIERTQNPNEEEEL